MSPGEENSVHEVLNQRLPLGGLGFDEIHQTIEVLGEVFPELELTSAAEFPKSIDIDMLRPTKSRGNAGGFQLWPALGMGVMDKAAGSLGVLNELESLGAQSRFSPPLQYLFLNNQLPVSKKEEVLTPLPVTLSKHQEAFLPA